LTPVRALPIAARMTSGLVRRLALGVLAAAIALGLAVFGPDPCRVGGWLAVLSVIVAEVVALWAWSTWSTEIAGARADRAKGIFAASLIGIGAGVVIAALSC
jgi:hypothetical protein